MQVQNSAPSVLPLQTRPANAPAQATPPASNPVEESSTDRPDDQAAKESTGNTAPPQQASGGQGENLVIDMLKKEIDRLEKLLTQQEQQLQLAQRRAEQDDGARVTVLMLGAAVNTTSAELANANAQLIAAMLDQKQP